MTEQINDGSLPDRSQPPENDQEIGRAIARTVAAREFDAQEMVQGGSLENQAVGAVVEELRRRRGMSRSDLAQKCGVEVAFLVVLENGDAVEEEVDLVVRETLAAGLGVSLHDFQDIVASSLPDARPVVAEDGGIANSLQNLLLRLIDGIPYFLGSQQGNQLAWAGGSISDRSLSVLRSLGTGSEGLGDESEELLQHLYVEHLDVVLKVEPLVTVEGRQSIAVIVMEPPDRGSGRLLGWKVELISGDQAYPAQETDRLGRAEFWDIAELDPKATYINVAKP